MAAVDAASWRQSRHMSSLWPPPWIDLGKKQMGKKGRKLTGGCDTASIRHARKGGTWLVRVCGDCRSVMIFPPAPLLEQPAVVRYLKRLDCSYSLVVDQARWTREFSSGSICRSVKPYVH
jgi:hypothetical protein